MSRKVLSRPFMRSRILCVALLLPVYWHAACVLVRTDKDRRIQKKTAVGGPQQVTGRHDAYRLSFVRTAGPDLVFGLTRFTTVKNYTSQVYDLEGIEVETIARDKNGAFKFYFMGPAWVTEESGGGPYARTLALSTCMTLGVGLLVAAFDWLSLPFRLGESDYEARKTERKEVSRKTLSAAVVAPASLEYARRVYSVDQGRVVLPRELFFTRKHRYPYGQIGFRVKKSDGSFSFRQFQKMKDLFTRAQFDAVTKGLPVYAPAPK